MAIEQRGDPAVEALPALPRAEHARIEVERAAGGQHVCRARPLDDVGDAARRHVEQCAAGGIQRIARAGEVAERGSVGGDQQPRLRTQPERDDTVGLAGRIGGARQRESCDPLNFGGQRR
jgi:hypothetical protein